jgi:hypothetical protein
LRRRAELAAAGRLPPVQRQRLRLRLLLIHYMNDLLVTGNNDVPDPLAAAAAAAAAAATTTWHSSAR